jgi:hypothetical protein
VELLRANVRLGAIAAAHRRLQPTAAIVDRTGGVPKHGVAHIHAVYGEHEISVEIETGTVHGHFPPRALKLVLEWMNLHTAELLENWQLAKQGRPLKRIAPLE